MLLPNQVEILLQSLELQVRTSTPLMSRVSRASRVSPWWSQWYETAPPKTGVSGGAQGLAMDVERALGAQAGQGALGNRWGDRDESRTSMGILKDTTNMTLVQLQTSSSPCKASWRFFSPSCDMNMGLIYVVGWGKEGKQPLAIFCPFYLIYSNFYLDLTFLGPTSLKCSELSSQCLRSQGWTSIVQITQLSLSSLEGLGLQK